MSVESQEFATEPVPPDHRVGWIRVGLVSAMVAFSLPTFVIGVEIFLVTSTDRAMTAILSGCALLAFIASLCGSVGARTHLSSYMLARTAFGVRGAGFINIAFALSLLGWFGVNIDLFGMALLRLLTETLNVTVSSWQVELFAGAVMTTTTIYGFRALNKLSTLLVPIMMVVTVLLIATAFDVRPLAEILSAEDASLMSFGDAVSSVVGGLIVGAVILPDITRFIRHWPGAIFTALSAYLVVTSLVMIAGGLAADALANDDFLDVMLAMGLGWGAFAIVIAGSWVLNTLNLYSTALSVDATFPGLENRLSIAALGIVGTAAAFLNILDFFLTFLFYLAIVFVPVAGVIVVDYLFARRFAYHGNGKSMQRDFVPQALIAWLIGASLALLGSWSVVHLSGIAALDAMLASALAYGLLHRFADSGGRAQAAMDATDKPPC